MTTEAENEAIVRDFYEFLNTDRDRFLEIVADDYVFNGEELGAEGYLQTHRRLHGPFPDYTNDVDRTVAQDDLVAAHWRGAGTHAGQSYWGVPASGTEFEISGISLFRVEDGLIAETWAHWDHFGLLRSLGVVPENFREIQARIQILQIILRVLRHNLQNDLNKVIGYAELAEGDDDSTDHLHQIQDTATALISIGQKAREIAKHMGESLELQTFDVVKVVNSVGEEFRGAHPDAEIDVSAKISDNKFAWYPGLLNLVLHEAIENAVIHSDKQNPRVDVTITPDTLEGYDALTITIADDGPGIPSHELEPIERATETPLEHASGIGLWAIKWGIERGFGELTFDENTHGGSTIRMTMPNIGDDFTYW